MLHCEGATFEFRRVYGSENFVFLLKEKGPKFPLTRILIFNVFKNSVVQEPSKFRSFSRLRYAYHM